MFSHIAYLGPLREYPKRSYVWAGESPIDVGRRGELAIPALLASRAKGSIISPGPRRRRRTVEGRVAEWLQHMGLIDSFVLKPITVNRKDYELRVTTGSEGAEVYITDVGFGVSQILPVLVLCYYVDEGSTILLEQPEIHLHPFVQAALADVLIDVVKNRSVQIIVESHSEHLLARLQRRIAEEAISPDMTALYFCRMDGIESRIERLNLDLFGYITNWPDDFFGDEMGDRVAMTEAAMRRMGAGRS
jgi:predicted ATPase